MSTNSEARANAATKKLFDAVMGAFEEIGPEQCIANLEKLRKMVEAKIEADAKASIDKP